MHMKLEALLDIPCLMLSICHFLDAIDAIQYLQLGRCQTKREGKENATYVELATGRNGRWWLYCNKFKCLPLSPTDSHSKCDIYWKSPCAQLERNGKI